jgi:hypothetical protein
MVVLQSFDPLMIYNNLNMPPEIKSYELNAIKRWNVINLYGIIIYIYVCLYFWSDTGCISVYDTPTEWSDNLCCICPYWSVLCVRFNIYFQTCLSDNDYLSDSLPFTCCKCLLTNNDVTTLCIGNGYRNSLWGYCYGVYVTSNVTAHGKSTFGLYVCCV